MSQVIEKVGHFLDGLQLFERFSARFLLLPSWMPRPGRAGDGCFKKRIHGDWAGQAVKAITMIGDSFTGMEGAERQWVGDNVRGIIS